MFRVTVFGEEAFRGNQALVCLSASPCGEAFMRDQARAAGLPACCFAWPGGEGVHQARCWSPAGHIACCGHGLLGTAHVLLNQGGIPRLRLDQDDGGQSLPAWRQDGLDWLGLPRLGCKPVAVPAWSGQVFSEVPSAAGQAGGESGYLVLEWGSEASLRELGLDPQALGRHTARAIVALAPAATPGFDYALRYFAPQYGVPEDAVTGSAHRVAAEYRGQAEARGLQCSPAGGVVYTRLSVDQLAIGGRVVCSE